MLQIWAKEVKRSWIQLFYGYEMLIFYCTGDKFLRSRGSDSVVGRRAQQYQTLDQHLTCVGSSAYFTVGHRHVQHSGIR